MCMKICTSLLFPGVRTSASHYFSIGTSSENLALKKQSTQSTSNLMAMWQFASLSEKSGEAIFQLAATDQADGTFALHPRLNGHKFNGPYGIFLFNTFLL